MAVSGLESQFWVLGRTCMCVHMQHCFHRGTLLTDLGALEEVGKREGGEEVGSAEDLHAPSIRTGGKQYITIRNEVI
eukprot:1117776-Pelagomonas_calceolata.AAC.7